VKTGNCAKSRAFEIGFTRERGVDAVLPVVGERPLPGEVLRSMTDAEEDE